MAANTKEEATGAGEIRVCYSNGTHLGEYLRDVDGYYNFWPTTRRGFWPGHLLREIADRLHDLNKEWDHEVSMIATK